MKKLYPILSAFTLAFLVFCMPMVTANASTHHTVSDSIEINCDSGSSADVNCCFDDHKGGNDIVFFNRTDLKSLKLFYKTPDFNWPKDVKLLNSPLPQKREVYLVEPIGLLIGSTISLE